MVYPESINSRLWRTENQGSVGRAAGQCLEASSPSLACGDRRCPRRLPAWQRHYLRDPPQRFKRLICVMKAGQSLSCITQRAWDCSKRPMWMEKCKHLCKGTYPIGLTQSVAHSSRRGRLLSSEPLSPPVRRGASVRGGPAAEPGRADLGRARSGQSASSHRQQGSSRDRGKAAPVLRVFNSVLDIALPLATPPRQTLPPVFPRLRRGE